MTKEEIYDAKIFPLMTQILEYCREAKIDFVATFELDRHNGKDVMLCTSGLVHPDTDQRLHDMLNMFDTPAGPPTFFAGVVNEVIGNADGDEDDKLQA